MRRLYRSKKDRMIAGVCGGLAEYFNVDPVLIRGVFVVAAFMGGMGVILYILLALVTPEEGNIPTSDSGSVGVEGGGKATIEDPPLHLPDMDQDRRWVFGVVILAIGVLMLLNRMSRLFPWGGWGFLSPLLVIAVGAYIFVTYRNKK